MRRLTDTELQEIEARATRNREGTDEPEADYLPGWRLRCRFVGVDCLILLQEIKAERERTENWRRLHIQAYTDYFQNGVEWAEKTADEEYREVYGGEM